MSYVRHYDNVLPKTFCDSVIKKFENHPKQQKETYLEGHRSFTELNLNALEKRVIGDALAKAGGNRTVAAGLLGISRRTLQRKLKESRHF
jgi:transcriptional regulator with PAS, ATPase and Fis domain